VPGLRRYFPARRSAARLRSGTARRRHGRGPW